MKIFGSKIPINQSKKLAIQAKFPPKTTKANNFP